MKKLGDRWIKKLCGNAEQRKVDDLLNKFNKERTKRSGNKAEKRKIGRKKENKLFQKKIVVIRKIRKLDRYCI